ncbi:mannose-6-phosphate isomerase [Cladochytrium replicatum]|nr:mannose-6-phosphate isomerase [Cladochytrium replicatum]
MSLHRISGATQSYDWGKVGSSSKVFELSKPTPGVSLSNDAPYAELWMGTHPSGQSFLFDTTTNQPGSRPLKSIMTPANLSEEVYAKFDGDLPFLFKVLSIRKALSIQAHPDKTLGKELHEKFPRIYKDPNHKPEMAIALTPFEAFIGFKPLKEIKSNLAEFPEFAALITPAVVEAFNAQVEETGDKSDFGSLESNKGALKRVFEALMVNKEDAITEQVRALVVRLSKEAAGALEGSLEELVLRLDQQFPNDIGTFCAFLLNYVRLSPGESIFLAANEPHAYLSGDCVECMAASDNVVRSGLTPKFKDIDTLVRMLTYNHGPPDAQVLLGDPYMDLPHTCLYDPPIEEFSILKTELPPRAHETVPGIDGPSVIIVTDGADGKIEYVTAEGDHHSVPAKVGFIFFVGAGLPVTVRSGSSGLILYRAFCTV